MDPPASADVIQLKRFVRQLESRLPADAMVFQLPFRTYMNDTGVARTGSYEDLRLYTVSRRLRWSFPAFSDEQVAWMKSAERLDPERLPCQPFAAIVIDRYGYWDNGAAIGTAVRAGLTATSVLAQSDRYLALDIRPLAICRDRDVEASDPAAAGDPRDAGLRGAAGTQYRQHRLGAGSLWRDGSGEGDTFTEGLGLGRRSAEQGARLRRGRRGGRDGVCQRTRG
jgi:hypothetical protein